MPTEYPEREDNRERHPWEHLEWIFQLLYWVRPDCRNWNHAASEMRKALIIATTGILKGRTNDDIRQLADDISQEWWKVALFRLFDKYNPDEPFFPYAYEALRRLCLPHSRRNARRELPGLSLEPLDHRCNPQRDERRRELRSRIGGALWKLPKQQRQAIMLRHWRKVSFVDIAKRHGCTANSLHLRVFHGLKKLEVMLADLAQYFRKKR